VTTNVTLHAGHDVAYFTRGQEAGGCAGAMSYYTATGEPPGVWEGKGAARLGLAGRIDADGIDRLFMKGIGPQGELLAARRRLTDAGKREEAAVAAYLAEHPYASAVEVAEVRAAERGKDPHTVPYFDLTVSVVKSVSVLHASYRVGARQARDRGGEDQAAALDAKADEIENALMESAREAVGWLEGHATYTRTGHHSSSTGEWRDGDGLVAGMFLHHISRDGDPQLHVHVAMWNRVQRADGADGKWRTLDSRTLHGQRLAVAAVTDRIMETRLAGLGYVMVPRADGNGAEVGGVAQNVMDLFSSRAVAVTGELQRLAREYEATHDTPPSRRTLWLLHQQAGQNTRRSKMDARRTLAGRTGSEEPTEDERLAAWEAQTTHREIQALSHVHGQAAQYAAGHADRAPAVLDDAAKRRAARIAVAEVQRHHAVWSMAQLFFEVHRALPVLPADADATLLITEVAKLAVSGRAGTGVVQVTAPDVTDVTSLGVRASDGGSVYRPPQDDRYTTLDHLDTEEQILSAAGQTVPQLVSEARAREAVAGSGLNAEQAAAVVMMLSATTAGTALTAPAGAGKSHTMAAFAGLWELLTGRRVIGLTTSTNAARVLASEGLAESYNIAGFLGKTEGSDELRRPIPVHAGDVVVIDEATQVSTADLAMLFETARVAGARVVLAGDTQQLGSPEAGGMFRLLTREVPATELTEVRRFQSLWEAGASVRLRAGEPGVIADYNRHGRIRAADQEAAYEHAVTAWLADHLRGKEVLLLAGSSEEAAGLARRVQAKLIQAGHVAAGVYQSQVPLADGNQARPGDLIRARLNTEIDAAGRKLTNRDTLKITAMRGDGVEVRRQRLDGTWTQKFWVPRSYLASSAELGYAGNVHVAQGRTVDTAHLLVTGTLSRQSLYVGMSRGREANTAHVVTGNSAPPGKHPYQQATPEAVLKNVMERDADELSATEAIRQSQEWAGGTGHLLNLWTAAARPAMHAEIDRQITAALTPGQAARYQQEHSRQALHTALRAAHLAGHDLHAIIDRITAAPLDGARSIASVLHGRFQRLHLTDPAVTATWTERTPAAAPPVAHEIAEALDARSPELGHRHAANPEPWLTDRLGILPPDASPMLSADFERRAGVAASYREAAGITNPYQAISPKPHHGNLELEHMRQEVIRELEYPDETAMWAGMGHGQLEAHTAAAERAQATAPPDVSGELRLTARAEADILQQAADAQVRIDHAEAASASELASELAARRQQLEAGNAKYEAWADATRAVRDNGDKASAELNRRGHTQPRPAQPPQPDPEPQTMAEWRREADQEIAHVDPAWWAQIKAGQAASVQAGKAARREASARAIPVTDAEIALYGTGHQDAVGTGQPWPPERQLPAEDGPETETRHETWPPRTDPAAEHDNPAAQISKAITDVEDAAQRVGAEQADRHARSEYAARIARQAEAQPEAMTGPHADLAAQAPDEAEIG
jgi:conjugative relaxase-like TrwC/TraI family protein